jgi:hypothetical protein
MTIHLLTNQMNGVQCVQQVSAGHIRVGCSPSACRTSALITHWVPLCTASSFTRRSTHALGAVACCSLKPLMTCSGIEHRGRDELQLCGNQELLKEEEKKERKNYINPYTHLYL